MTRSARWVAATLGVILLLAAALAASRGRVPTPDAAPPSASPPPTAAPLPAPPPSTPSPDADDGALVRDPEAAAAVPAERLLAAGFALASGDWSDLGHPAWPPVERPVYVATATVDGRTRVDADVVIAFRSDTARDRVALRLLPAASALSDVVGPPRVVVQRAGAAAPHEVDRAGALLSVELEPPVAAGEAVSLRVQLSYDLVPRSEVLDDGGPAGFGLLASNPDVSLLGHWLPLLTLEDNDGPMIPWGDVGAFPAAVWSVQVDHGDDVFVSGGDDGPCPARVGTDGCTWARGVALRDVSAAVYVPTVEVAEGESADGVRVRSFGVVPGEVAVAVAQSESLVGVDVFTDAFGPLAWRELDVVGAPLSSGAAGMEFPGLIVIREDTYAALGGGFGTYVIAHEVAHQWFHALVGNGSLSDPVVDESLAQYASVLYYAAVYGEDAAEDLWRRYMSSRADRYRDAGGAREPAAQPLSEFEGSGAYGSIVYGRAPLAWIEAEREVGRDIVVTFLRDLVARFGLDVITDDEVLSAAPSRVVDHLRCYWFDPDWECG